MGTDRRKQILLGTLVVLLGALAYRAIDHVLHVVGDV